MVETNPLKWFIRDIDIGDSGGKSSAAAGKSVGKSGENKETPKVEMFGHRPIRTRSRHECHFATGSSVPMGKKIVPSEKLLLFLFIGFYFYFYFFVTKCTGFLCIFS